MFNTTITCDAARDFTGRMLARKVAGPPRGVLISISRLVTALPLLAAARINSGSGAGNELMEAFFNRAARASQMRGGLGGAGDNAFARAQRPALRR